MFWMTSPDQKLLKAATDGRINDMQAALDDGADINARNKKGETALRLSVMNNNIAATLMLVRLNADPNVQNNEGLTPLSRAAGQGFNDILKLLLDIPGIAINLQDNDGNTPLRLASIRNQTESVRLLLEKGAHPNIQNHEGNTPLNRAASEGYTEIVKLLLAHGARSDIPNNAGLDAMYYTRRAHKHAIGILLENARMEERPSRATQRALPAPDAAETSATADVRWHVTDDLEIARVARKPAIEREVTEIFNFRALRVITTIKDTSLNTSTSFEKPLKEIEPAWLAQALDAYEAETKVRPDIEDTRLQKPRAVLKSPAAHNGG